VFYNKLKQNHATMIARQTEIEFGTQFIASGSLKKIIRNPYHIREFETLNGIPDLVLITGAKLDAFKNFENKYPHIASTSGAARVFAVLNKKAFRPENDVIRLTGLSKSYFAKIIKDLLQIDAIEYSKIRGYRIRRDFELPSPKIISIEFKLDNWQKALVQATRHRAFAARSFVIMPAAKNALLRKNLDQFITFGISVGTFNPQTEEFEIIWRAPSNTAAYHPKSKISYVDSLYRIVKTLNQLQHATN